MRNLIWLGVLVAGISPIVQADFIRGDQTFALYGGFGGSTSRYDLKGPKEKPITDAGASWGAQYFYFYRESPSFAVGVDWATSENSAYRTNLLLANFDATSRLRSTVVMAMLKLTYPKGTWRPYLFTGLGAHHSSAYLSAKPERGHTWSDTGTQESRVLTDDRATSVAVGYGFGMDLFAGERYFLGLELRGTWLAGLDDDTNPQAVSAGVHVDRESPNQGNMLLRAGVRF